MSNTDPSITPLFTALQRFRDQSPLRMAMPGHKGQPLPGLGADMSLDFTELPPTGNLYAPGGVIEEAEQLWAETWGADCCLFLTGGATQGIHTALLAAAGVGKEILVDRVSHQSLHTGMALLDLRPVWLERPWLDDKGVVGPLPPETVEQALSQHANIKTVCITSPTYYGVLSDIPAIAAVCHRHGARLIVDAAHGAHLFMLGDNPFRGADLVITSTHKTLRAPGQSALLFGTGISLEQLRQASGIFATSSPSYLMMAALDALRPWCLGEGGERYRETARRVAALRRRYPSLQEGDGPLDPCRFVLCVPDGFGVEARLQGQNIWPEMADMGHVVLILTDSDDAEAIARLCRALDGLGLGNQPCCGPSLPPPPVPETLLSPREAMFGAKQKVPFAAAEGGIAAHPLAPYPPGVPVCAPGERISKKVLFYLQEIGYNRPYIEILTQKEQETAERGNPL